MAPELTVKTRPKNAGGAGATSKLELGALAMPIRMLLEEFRRAQDVLLA